MTRAVLFDLDGTLLCHDFQRFTPGYIAAVVGFYRDALGRDTTQVMMDSVARMFANDGSARNADVFWRAASDQLSIDRAELERLYDEFVQRVAPTLAAGIRVHAAARATLETCRAGGRHVVLATNPAFPRSFIDERIRWAGLDPAAFDLVTCADRMHFCKPSTGYYREVADLIGVAPSECLMVGNEVAMDLVPAARIGMTTCLVAGEFVVAGDPAFVPDHTATLDELPALLARLE